MTNQKNNNKNSTSNNSQSNKTKHIFDSGKFVRVNENGPKEGGQPIIRNNLGNKSTEK